MTMTHKEAIDRVMGDSPWDHDYDAAKKQIRAYVEARGLALVPRDDVTSEMIAAYDKAEWLKRSDMMSPTPTEEYEAGGGPIGYGLRAAIAAAPDPFEEGECGDAEEVDIGSPYRIGDEPY